MITEHKTGIGRVETLECVVVQAASGIARMSNLATWAHSECA